MTVRPHAQERGVVLHHCPAYTSNFQSLSSAFVFARVTKGVGTADFANAGDGGTETCRLTAVALVSILIDQNFALKISAIQIRIFNRCQVHLCLHGVAAWGLAIWAVRQHFIGD